MGAGTAGIVGVHTYLYYYRPKQHMTVPRVIQYNTNIDRLQELTRGYSYPRQRGINSVPL